MNIAILITSFNRVGKTISCLDALYCSVFSDNVSFQVFLVDDGCTDGTSTAVLDKYPQVNLIKSEGNLFWNKAMCLAFDVAKKSNFDAYLWLNDDTSLYSDAISRLLAAHDELLARFSKSCIVVGSTIGDDGVLSYGGSVSVSKLNPFKYKKVWSPVELIECEAMNGNCVLIPKEVTNKLGNLDYSFEHAMGDTDYSLRARREGFKVFVLPGYVGECSINSQTNTYADRSLPLSQRWRLMKSKKGLPIKSWLLFTRRHGGFFWPIFFLWPYIKLIFR